MIALVALAPLALPTASEAAADCVDPGEDCRESGCCRTPGWTCYEKNDHWGGCRPSCAPGIHQHDPWEYQTPWTCRVLQQGPGPDVPVGPSPASPEGSPVAEHGFLQVEGNRIVGQHGQAVQLRGMSLFWSQWMSQYWNKGVVDWLKEDWKVSVVRAAVGVEHGGHLENPHTETQRVTAIVRAAINAGIYVIVDWHDHNADQHRAEASEFFDFMAREFGHFPNVLFETFNEPEHQSWSQTIKPYHDELVRVVRRHSKNLIICGTRTWSQDVGEASGDRVQGENLAYTIHFYATTHSEPLRQKARTALANGVALFATEWGTCEATGDGSLHLSEARAWLQFFDEHKISHANWAVSDKSESCSALRPGADPSGGWPLDQLTESGAFVRAWLRGEGSAGAAVTGGGGGGACAGEHGDCRASRCCSTPGWTCYEKNEHWAGCRPSCERGIHHGDAAEHRTPWSCSVLQLFANDTVSVDGETSSQLRARSAVAKPRTLAAALGFLALVGGVAVLGGLVRIRRAIGLRAVSKGVSRPLTEVDAACLE